jgi:hypothetical protein
VTLHAHLTGVRAAAEVYGTKNLTYRLGRQTGRMKS